MRKFIVIIVGGITLLAALGLQAARIGRHYRPFEILAPRDVTDKDADPAMELARYEEFRARWWQEHGEEIEQERQEQLARWRGTNIHSDPAAVGQVRDIQIAFCRALAKADQAPQERLNHFAWVEQVPEGGELQTYPVRGWFGRIVAMEPTLSGYRFKVKIGPHLVSPRGGIPFTHDSCLELYDFSADGELTYLGTEVEPGHTHGGILID